LFAKNARDFLCRGELRSPVVSGSPRRAWTIVLPHFPDYFRWRNGVIVIFPGDLFFYGLKTIGSPIFIKPPKKSTTRNQWGKNNTGKSTRAKQNRQDKTGETTRANAVRPYQGNPIAFFAASQNSQRLLEPKRVYDNCKIVFVIVEPAFQSSKGEGITFVAMVNHILPQPEFEIAL